MMVLVVALPVCRRNPYDGNNDDKETKEILADVSSSFVSDNVNDYSGGGVIEDAAEEADDEDDASQAAAIITASALHLLGPATTVNNVVVRISSAHTTTTITKTNNYYNIKDHCYALLNMSSSSSIGHRRRDGNRHELEEFFREVLIAACEIEHIHRNEIWHIEWRLCE